MASSNSNPDNTRFTAALRLLDQFLKANKLDYCIIGGLAVQVRGRPRFTRDIDLTILCDLEDETRIIEALLQTFPARLEDAREFALQNKVVLIAVESIPVDIGVGLTRFEHETVRSAVHEQISKDLVIPVCTSEDLIIHKVLAGRESDWLDIKSVADRAGENLNEDHIIKTLESFSEILGHDYPGAYRTRVRKGSS